MYSYNGGMMKTVWQDFFKKLWVGFNYWRKRYCFTRILVILLLCAPLLYELLSGNLVIRNLVRIACDGIFMSSIPQSEDALCRYYKFQEKRRLQFLIINLADRNGDKKLNEKEIEYLRKYKCDIDAICKSPKKLNLKQLADNAKLLGLLPTGYLVKEKRMQAFFAAHAENEFFYNPLKKKVYHTLNQSGRFFPKYTNEEMAMIKAGYYGGKLKDTEIFPDYTTWATWKNGLNIFYSQITFMFTPFFPFISWFVVSMLFSLLLKLKIRKYANVFSIAGSLVFLGITFYMGEIVNYDLFYKRNGFWGIFDLSAVIFSFICLSITAGLCGLKIEKCIKNKKIWVWFTVFLMGLVLFFRNLHIASAISCLGWYGVGIFVKPTSFFGKTLYNEWFFLAVFMMIFSMFMLYRYYIHLKSEK